MKPAPELIPTQALENDRTVRKTLPQVDYSYQSTVTASRPVSKTDARLAELKTFRALSRDFFAGEAARESLKEIIVFAWIMAVAAWPLSVTLNQLGTMMISPPPWVVG
jgi:hypothetical protein